MVELEQYRVAGLAVVQGVVGALAQGVPEQQGALVEVGQVVGPVGGAGRLRGALGQRLQRVCLAPAEIVLQVARLQPLQLADMLKVVVERGEAVFLLRKKSPGS
ncbi:hypothetical protein ACFSHR_14040 [Azotobacter chroococcum]